MLPSLLRAKVDHASFNTWKSLSEKDREDWPTIQVSFLRATEKNFTANHDTSSKFRSANQRSDGRKNLTDKEKKLFKEACEKGEGVPGSIWHKLTGKEKSELSKAKREKKAQNDGGLGSQYSVNQQMTSLPPGMILVPMMPQSQATNTQLQ
eukprot:4919350-Ditylum_brightwellii.AAC.1